MAKTNKPISVLVDPGWYGHGDIQDLIAKGNTVISVDEYTGSPDIYSFDLILYQKAWRIVPGMESQIKYAIQAARKAKYGGKDADKD